MESPDLYRNMYFENRPARVKDGDGPATCKTDSYRSTYVIRDYHFLTVSSLVMQETK